MDFKLHIPNFLTSWVSTTQTEKIAHVPPQENPPTPSATQSIPPPPKTTPQASMRVAFARSHVSASGNIQHSPPNPAEKAITNTAPASAKFAMKPNATSTSMGNVITTGRAGFAVSYDVKKHATQPGIAIKRTGLAPQKQQPFLVTAIIKTLPARFKQERIDTPAR